MIYYDMPLRVKKNRLELYDRSDKNFWKSNENRYIDNYVWQNTGNY